ncbi:hypothetical protein [Streptobacillus moniliformis]|uniref:hypothetical protein n=1 Tax=Streptobacillus moniliformis TaxID=34105 RepID=UPI0007E3ECD8|nr:hypothetical protein [Streptobacillus moniliformis]
MNTKEFLREKVKNKNFKIKTIMLALNINGRHQLSKRYKGIVKFTAKEVFILKDLLDLTDNEIRKYLIK